MIIDKDSRDRSVRDTARQLMSRAWVCLNKTTSGDHGRVLDLVSNNNLDITLTLGLNKAAKSLAIRDGAPHRVEINTEYDSAVILAYGQSLIMAPAGPAD